MAGETVRTDLAPHGEDGSRRKFRRRSRVDDPDTGFDDHDEKKSPLTAAALQVAFLTVEDLPAGYALSPPNEDDGDDRTTPTATGPTRQDRPAALDKEIGFRKGPVGPFLSQCILQYAVGDEAERYRAEFRRRLASCASYDQPGDDGETSTEGAIRADGSGVDRAGTGRANGPSVSVVAPAGRRPAVSVVAPAWPLVR